MPKVAGTPFAWNGMRLGKFDRPLVHNHKLLERVYWGRRYGEVAGPIWDGNGIAPEPGVARDSNGSPTAEP